MGWPAEMSCSGHMGGGGPRSVVCLLLSCRRGLNVFFFTRFFLLLPGPCVCFCALCPRASVSVCPRCVCLCCLSLSVLVDCVCPVLWRLLCPEKGQPADKSLECAVRDEMRCDEVPISKRCTLQRQIVRVPGSVWEGCGRGPGSVL